MGKHRTTSRLPFVIRFAAVLAVIWVAILAVFCYHHPVPVPAARLAPAPVTTTAPPVVPEPEPPPPPAARMHVVTAGENLWVIARQACGNGIYWKRIAAENKLSNAWQLKIGEKLSVACH